VTSRATCRVRSNQWPSSIVASTAATFSISTHDPSLSVMSVPMPALVLGLRSASAIPFNLSQTAMPAPAWRAPPLAADPAVKADREAAPEASPMTDQPEQAAAAEAVDQPPPDEATAEGADPWEAPAFEAEAADATPPADEQPAAPPSETEAKPNGQSRGMELMIDSLPHHSLTESIPVTLTPLGDGVFTVAVRDINISATGGTIAEALLVLKEQIEYVYDDLSKQSQLDSDQKAMLKGLRAYIPVPRKQTVETNPPAASRMRSLFR
jgi:hypothetical protein